MTTSVTQRDRTLRMLRRAGRHGLTQLDVDGPTPDGGPPIRRLAARVNELRDAGYTIERRGRRQKMAVYILAPAPPPSPPRPAEADAHAVLPASTGALFEMDELR